MLLLAAAPAAVAQEEAPLSGPPSVAEAASDESRGSLSGTIYDRGGAVTGATIELRPRRPASAGSTSSRERAHPDVATDDAEDATTLSAVTDEGGGYRIDGVPAGGWSIVVRAPGFLPSQGYVSVRGPTQLDVELRRLDEPTAAFVEGNPESTVREWLWRANELLEQGWLEEARTEYGKALPLLDRAGQGEVRRALARILYLEGEVEAALEELWQSLELDPDSEPGRQLWRALMEQTGRGDEIDERLAELERLPADAAELARPVERAATVAAWQPPPAVPASRQALQEATGELTVSLPRAPSARHFAEVRERFGRLGGSPAGELYDPAGESYSLWVPESYRAEDGWGLLVWISPTRSGGVPSDEVKELLAERRVLWIGAHEAGNPRPAWERLALALDAAAELPRFYDLDPERIWVGGYSGGGRMASAALLLFPERFRGAVCWMGVDFWSRVPVPFAPGFSWPASFRRPSRQVVDRVETERRLALVTGELDFNRSETRAVHRAMELAGFAGIRYLEIPAADHYHGLDTAWLAVALAWLDGKALPLPASPDTPAR